MPKPIHISRESDLSFKLTILIKYNDSFRFNCLDKVIEYSSIVLEYT